MSISLLSSYAPHSWPQANTLAGGTSSSSKNQQTSSLVQLSAQGKQLSAIRKKKGGTNQCSSPRVREDFTEAKGCNVNKWPPYTGQSND